MTSAARHFDLLRAVTTVASAQCADSPDPLILTLYVCVNNSDS